ncbi:uncharacterized protein BXZ73DRAFT_97616 [Epithele typhae]|uniref:uncharacterized protein n=1 Tax=Epithele typhae TaxID=378194 RepID=UPI002007B22C|nr:uncharacterized protein BXZ73DRAFT_97616 [Epithele typhae]KAH9942197.1 hypothetical protein BXZ73DRAFT_97616 [Epithele typhae]
MSSPVFCFSNKKPTLCKSVCAEAQNELALMVTHFVNHLFAHPTGPEDIPLLPLASCYLHKMVHWKMAPATPFVALYLLQRLRTYHSSLPQTPAHLFMAACMVAAKVVEDHTYQSAYVSNVIEGLWSSEELSQMERQFCQDLRWDLNVHPEALADFERRVRSDYAGDGPYPEYLLPDSNLGPQDATAVVGATFDPVRGSPEPLEQSTLSFVYPPLRADPFVLVTPSDFAYPTPSADSELDSPIHPGLRSKWSSSEADFTSDGDWDSDESEWEESPPWPEPERDPASAGVWAHFSAGVPAAAC